MPAPVPVAATVDFGLARAAPSNATATSELTATPTAAGDGTLGLWSASSGPAATTASTAKMAMSITPATMPAVVRTSVKPNKPIHNDSR